MAKQQVRPIVVIGGILVAGVIVITSARYSGGGDSKDPAGNESAAPAPGGKTTDPSSGDKAAEAAALLAKLEGLLKDDTPIPHDLKIAADRFIDLAEVPYKTRIGLALAAFDERSATKQVEIIFREVAKRPFETIAELFPLVPEGPMQDRVADAIGQVVAISPGDAPQAVAWLESMSASPRKEAVSIIAYRLEHAGDLATLKSLEASANLEDLKKSFGWWVAEVEKKKGVRQ